MIARHLTICIGLATQCIATASCQAEAAKDQATLCVEVDVGGEHVTSLDCLNQNFAQAAKLAHREQPVAAPVDGHSPSTVVGTANQAAAREMMGNAFGKSAVPQRPQLYYGAPLLQPK